MPGSVQTEQNGKCNVGFPGAPSVPRSGPWSVAISGTPDGNVANTRGSPVLVCDGRNPARHPVQIVAAFSIDSDAIGNFADARDASGRFVVPAGKHLVMEHVSLTVLLPAGQKVVKVNFSTAAADSLRIRKSVVPALLGTDPRGADRFGDSQALRACFEPGSAIRVFCLRNSTVGTGEVRADISGYLEDLP